MEIKKKVGVETICVVEHEDEEGNVVTKKLKIKTPAEEDESILKELNYDADAEELELDDMKFYPNPTKGMINFEFEGNGNGPTNIKRLGRRDIPRR